MEEEVCLTLVPSIVSLVPPSGGKLRIFKKIIYSPKSGEL